MQKRFIGPIMHFPSVLLYLISRENFLSTDECVVFSISSDRVNRAEFQIISYIIITLNLLNTVTLAITEMVKYIESNAHYAAVYLS